MDWHVAFVAFIATFALSFTVCCIKDLITYRQAIYAYFAQAPAGSVANHLAHCLLAAGIALVIGVPFLLIFGNPAGPLAAFVAGAFFYIGRAQDQTETALAPAPWFMSWAIPQWKPDQFYGALFPTVSSAVLFGGFELLWRFA